MDRSERVFLGGVIVVALSLVGLMIFAAVMESDACREAGGSIKTLTGTGIGIMPNGSVGPSFTTTRICVSADGRILQ